MRASRPNGDGAQGRAGSRSGFENVVRAVIAPMLRGATDTDATAPYRVRAPVPVDTVASATVNRSTALP